jgi:hypothetical protein
LLLCNELLLDSDRAGLLRTVGQIGIDPVIYPVHQFRFRHGSHQRIGCVYCKVGAVRERVLMESQPSPKEKLGAWQSVTIRNHLLDNAVPKGVFGV